MAIQSPKNLRKVFISGFSKDRGQNEETSSVDPWSWIILKVCQNKNSTKLYYYFVELFRTMNCFRFWWIGKFGYIDIGDECSRQNVGDKFWMLVTVSGW